ncbi:MAG TPA: DinB family protein [Anaerolineales bacterium]|nr:DinB family protein [Anaerolineales bacterium]
MEEILKHAHAVLSSTPLRWKNMAETLPTDLLSLPPAPGEWSALECLLHLLDAERWVFPARVRYLLAEQDFPAFNPDEDGTKPDGHISVHLLAAEFETLRQESLSLLVEVSPADLDKRARHQELGPVTLSELLHEWAAHDLMHTVQAERAMMQPFIKGCGPWERYFTDHIISTGRVPAG